jgi:hypothetical protein
VDEREISTDYNTIRAAPLGVKFSLNGLAARLSCAPRVLSYTGAAVGENGRPGRAAKEVEMVRKRQLLVNLSEARLNLCYRVSTSQRCTRRDGRALCAGPTTRLREARAKSGRLGGGRRTWARYRR